MCAKGSHPFLLLLLISLIRGSLGTYNMSASGGGLVATGESLTLSASVGTEFDRCYWYFPPKAEKCIFGGGKVIRCTDESLKARVNYTGSDPKVCQISLNKLKEAEEGDFECSLDGATPRGKIHVALATKIKKIEVRVGNESEGYLEAGKAGPIFCILSGGKPVGESNITTSEGLNITSDESSIIKGHNGGDISSHKILINVEVKDHGAVINCTGHQYDKSDPKKDMFAAVTAPSTSLVVVFPPQPVDPIVVTGTIGEELKVMIPVHSNPSPDTFKWMAKQSENGSETSTELKNGDKVKIPMICTNVAENKKNCSIIFTSLSKEDLRGVVSYELQIENKFGKASLGFSIRTPNSTTLPPPSTSTPGGNSTMTTTTPNNSSTTPSATTTPAPGGGGVSSYVIPLVIFIVIIVVLIGGMIAYKRYSAKRQTAPMSMQ